MKKIIYISIILFSFLACKKSNDGIITGTVATADGSTVSNITVKLYNMNSVLYQTVNTDSKGEYTFMDVKSGNYYIAATATINGSTYDTGNYPQIVYVSGEIVKTVSLSLSKK